LATPAGRTLKKRVPGELLVALAVVDVLIGLIVGGGLLPQQLTDFGQVLFAVAIAKEAEVSDALQALNEPRGIKGLMLSFILCGVDRSQSRRPEVVVL